MTHTDTSSAEQQFGTQVREAREVRGWSQEALARHLRDAAGIDLHQTAIARLERGERTIRFNEVVALSKVLGIELSVYSSEIPQLTPDEYAEAQQILPGLLNREWDARGALADLREKYQAEFLEAEKKVSAIRDQRKRLEAAIREYEERQGG
ncbi:helix-turn-helix domain-containing protein [Micromonospora tulbaghiae]|uniref:helix-turn-helix domain-containing protein n=1 Tax=Micromonospora tulbaghiae TaxID=479978 RepID=UPI0033D18267